LLTTRSGTLFRLDGHAADDVAEDEAEAAEQQTARHQDERGEEKGPLAQGFFSSAARAFS